MLIGFHYLPGGEDDTGPVMPASTFLDLAPTRGMLSPERMVRPYFKGKPDPREFASKVALWTAAGVRIQCMNEPNLPAEGFGGSVADYWAWFHAIRELAPGARLYCAGMSPGVPGWESWYSGAASPDCDGIAAHVYGTFEQMRAIVRVLLGLGKRIWIAECNFGAGQQVDRDRWAREHLRPFLDWCAGIPQVEAVTYFAYRWPTPDMALPTPVDGAGTAIETTLRAWTTPQEQSVTLAVVPTGRGFWVWEVDACGGVDGIIATARRTGCTHVIVKVGDGPARWTRVTREMIAALKAAGLAVYVWVYVYGGYLPGTVHDGHWTVDDEIAVAQWALEFGADGIVADVEAEYEGRWREAERYAYQVRQAWAGLFFGYAPLPHIDYHPALPYVQFNAVCDAVMPQWYGENMTAEAPPGRGYDPARFVRMWGEWIARWQDAQQAVPILMPIGETYGVATPAGIQAFESTVAAQGYPAWSYWSMQHATPEHIATLEAMVTPADPPAPSVDPVTSALDGIWQETLDLAAAGETDRAVRIQEKVVALKRAIGREAA